MKIRGLILLALMIGGAYMMFQTYEDDEPKAFIEILNDQPASFHSLTFTKPINHGARAESWIVDEPEEIDLLLRFLQNYHVRQIQPEEINQYDEVNNFSIQLHDENGRRLSIMINDDLIIQDAALYYEVVDGPLDVNWLLSFFISNQ